MATKAPIGTMDMRHVQQRVSPLEARATTPFVLSSAAGTLVGHGSSQVLNFEGRHDLAESVASYFAETRGADRTRPGCLVGAIPFSSHGRPHLYQPARLERRSGGWSTRVLAQSVPSAWSVRAEPSRTEYARRVGQALERMRPESGGLRKVVLGRRLILSADAPIDVNSVIANLATDPDSTTFAVPLPAGRNGMPRVLVGATPELLVEKTRGIVRSEPMAGSAKRHADPDADREAAEQLLHSEKNLREHATVVEWVVDRLAPYCRSMRVSEKPMLRSTSTMWHLVTPIEGELIDDHVPSIELATVLHPTPAVCGVPRDVAERAIDELESFDRGFFTGAVGWCNADGDGRWLVTLRCGEISGQTAALYAGAGIVTGSDPQSEAAETSAKFATFLRALGVDEDGRPLAGPGR